MDSAKLEKEKHVRYFLRCLKTFLPYYYTSNDPNRMSLAFFIMSALDILGAIDTSVSSDERAGYIDWIYRCQHPEGGFRAFPGTDFDHRSTESNAVWDPAHVPATYFALAILLILRDDFKRVKREECLKWLVRMQRPDGSFGQTVGPDGILEGGFDPRFGYTALCIRWFLRKPADSVPDIDFETLASNIMKRQVRPNSHSWTSN
jgi:geranylgeranyl transferase type-1 subunit beta